MVSSCFVSEPREIRCYQYVNRPYATVRDALRSDAATIFREATTAASARARAVAASLRVAIVGVEVGAEVSLSVKSIEEEISVLRSPVTCLRIEWEADKTPSMFPYMDAEFRVYPLTAEETQLDFAGRYAPPLGLLGKAVDALVGHRIAEASVHRFVQDVAEHLKTNLPRE